jgi:hypothetical protein
VSLLDAIDVLEVNLTVALAAATGFVGFVLVVSAWFGRARGLIWLGLALALATATASALDVPLRGGIGEARHRPLTVAEVPGRYQLGIGHLVLDLRALALAEPTTIVRARVGIGQLEVDVPADVRVDVRAHAGAGSLVLFGRETGGWGRDERVVAAGTASPTLELDLRVGAGQVVVRRFETTGDEIVGGTTR